MRRLIAIAVLVTLSFAVSAAPPPSPPRFQRVFIVVLENEDESNAMAEPFLAELAKRGARLTGYHALEHISQPNYLALTSGSTWGLTRPLGDQAMSIDTTHIGDLLEARKLNWKVYAEGYPGDCFLGRSQGSYARKHVPFLSYKNVQQDKARCVAHVFNADQFDKDIAAGALPEYSLYVPDNKNNGHDTDSKIASKWLAKRFGSLLDDTRFMNGTLFVVTFDEGRVRSDNTIYTVLVGDAVKPGVYAGHYTPYDLLRTIEDAFGLGTLGRGDEKAKGISGVWSGTRRGEP